MTGPLIHWIEKAYLGILSILKVLLSLGQLWNRNWSPCLQWRPNIMWWLMPSRRPFNFMPFLDLWNFLYLVLSQYWAIIKQHALSPTHLRFLLVWSTLTFTIILFGNMSRPVIFGRLGYLLRTSPPIFLLSTIFPCFFSPSQCFGPFCASFFGLGLFCFLFSLSFILVSFCSDGGVLTYMVRTSSHNLDHMALPNLYSCHFATFLPQSLSLPLRKYVSHLLSTCYSPSGAKSPSM